MTYLRTIMGMSKDLFDWHYQLNRDFNFAGGLTANLNKLFENCAKMHGPVDPEKRDDFKGSSHR